MHKIALIGGDARQITAAKYLFDYGYEIAVYGFDKYTEKINQCLCLYDTLKSAYAVILPLPYTTDGININAPFCSKIIEIKEITDIIKSNQILIGGCLGNEITQNKKYKVIDFAKRDDFKALNAVSTAEGAIAIAIEQTDTTLNGTKCAVLSYGNIGEYIAKSLISLGCEVTVAARRSSSRAKAKTAGCKVCDFDKLPEILNENRIVFNAVPHKIIDSKALESMKKSSIIIDLASKPGGVDLKSAEKFGIKVIWALSLPGKIAPVSAGKDIAETIKNIIEGVE